MSLFLEMHTRVSLCVYACLQVCIFVVCSKLASKIGHKYVSVHAITPQVAEPVFGTWSEMPSSVSVCPNISSLHPCYLLRRPASSSSGPGLRQCKPVLSVLAIVTRERGGGRNQSGNETSPKRLLVIFSKFQRMILQRVAKR